MMNQERDAKAPAAAESSFNDLEQSFSTTLKGSKHGDPMCYAIVCYNGR